MDKQRILEGLLTICEQEDPFSETFNRSFSLITQIKNDVDISLEDIDKINNAYRSIKLHQFKARYSFIDWEIVNSKIISSKGDAKRYIYESIKDTNVSSDKAALLSNQLIKQWITLTDEPEQGRNRT